MRLCDKDVHSGHIFPIPQGCSKPSPSNRMSILVAEADGFFPAARRWHKITLRRRDCWLVTIDYLTMMAGDRARTFEATVEFDDDEDVDEDDKGLVRFFKAHAKMLESQDTTYVRGLRPIGADKESREARDDVLKDISGRYRASFGRLLADAGLLDDPNFYRAMSLNPTLAVAAQHRNENIAAEAFASLAWMIRETAPEEYDGPPPPAEPSDLEPGSSSKLDLLEWRASGEKLNDELRQLFGDKSHPLQCFHPDEAPDDSYARIVATVRNGRPKRVDVISESFAEHDADDAEFELERLVAIDEARHVRSKKVAA